MDLSRSVRFILYGEVLSVVNRTSLVYTFVASVEAEPLGVKLLSLDVGADRIRHHSIDGLPGKDPFPDFGGTDIHQGIFDRIYG